MIHPRRALIAAALFAAGASLIAQDTGAQGKAAQGSATPNAAAQNAAVQTALEGVASWYGPDFHGRKTANGEVYDKERLTAAHRTLPFGTYVRVESLDSGASVIVRVNDRGPFAKDRIIDLSEAAARIVGMIPTGTARVRLTVVPKEEALAWRGGAVEGAVSPDAVVDPSAAASAPASPALPDAARVRIQVASYSSQANAEATVKRLAASGLTAVIESAAGHFRVAFPDLSPDEARVVSAKLDGLGYRGYSVTTSKPQATR